MDEWNEWVAGFITRLLGEWMYAWMSKQIMKKEKELLTF